MPEEVRLLSLDIPWGQGIYVGGAYAEVKGGDIVGLRVASVDSRIAHAAPIPPQGCPATSEMDGFIVDGAGPGKSRLSDQQGPFNSFPHDVVTRRAYLLRLWRTFHELHRLLDLPTKELDLITVDVPMVTAGLASTVPAPGRAAAYRPVEAAFGNRVMVPGAAPATANGRLQFPRFQAGNINGSRPGYAIFEMARIVFSGRSVVESFPQLSLGPLGELAQHQGVPLLSRLAAHKTGNGNALSLGQSKLNAQVTAFLGGTAPAWMGNPTPAARGDGYDALLGLLPALIHKGWSVPTPQGGAPPMVAVRLKNLASPHPAFPISQGAGNPARGCGPWIDAAPAFAAGIDDSGILCLFLSLWGP